MVTLIVITVSSKYYITWLKAVCGKYFDVIILKKTITYNNKLSKASSRGLVVKAEDS